MKPEISNQITNQAETMYGQTDLGHLIAAVQYLISQAKTARNHQSLADLTAARIELHSQIKQNCPASNRVSCIGCPIGSGVTGDNDSLSVSKNYIDNLDPHIQLSTEYRPSDAWISLPSRTYIYCQSGKRILINPYR